MLENITDRTRFIARTLAGAVRSVILSDPGRLMADDADMNKWNTPKFHHDLDFIEFCSPELSVNVVRDFLAGKGKTAVIPELHVIHRLEWETDLIRHVTDALVRRMKPYRESVIGQGSFSVRPKSPEEVLYMIQGALEGFCNTYLPVLQLWADSPITASAPDTDSDGASENHWKMFSECLPGFPAPGDIYPNLEKLARERADNPFLLELIRTDEAVYTVLVLLVLLYDGIPNCNPVWDGYDAFCAEGRLGTCEGNAGWSGGDGLMNSLLRLHAVTSKLFRSLTLLLTDMKAGTDWSIFAQISMAVYG